MAALSRRGRSVLCLLLQDTWEPGAMPSHPFVLQYPPHRPPTPTPGPALLEEDTFLGAFRTMQLPDNEWKGLRAARQTVWVLCGFE